MASMEPTQITLAIRSTLNTTHIIQQYMQHQNLAKRYRASRRRQRGDESDEDMDIDFSQSMGPGNVGIMVLMGEAMGFFVGYRVTLYSDTPKQYFSGQNRQCQRTGAEKEDKIGYTGDLTCIATVVPV
ncbi:hypothetical protein UY3_19048 [Chelonia mydas]|uniref:Uncharacterized protein n=1 Tax=Chelonia mydas TaxID=8469 RepID=M7AHU2_CHEMY|nr:hypothetical protein UY3_19048 [Chelonia mydas]